jgi:signal transduction histidine kinase
MDPPISVTDDRWPELAALRQRLADSEAALKEAQSYAAQLQAALSTHAVLERAAAGRAAPAIAEAALPTGPGAQRELLFFNRAMRGLTSTLNLDEVLNLVLEELRGALGITASSIWLLDSETNELVCRQATGLHSDKVRNRRVPVGTGIIGWTAAHDQAVIVDDAQQDERHYRLIDQSTGLRVRSVLSVPLRSSQQVLGVIQAIDEESSRFQVDDLRLVELLATAATIGIENARLFEETQLRADRLAALNEISTAINQPQELNAVVQLVVKQLAQALHLSQTGLALFDETRQHLIVVADLTASGSAPISGAEIPLAGNASMDYILETRRPLAIEDAQHDPRLAGLHDMMRQRQVRSVLLVPLMVRDEVIGTFGCDYLDEPHRFSQEEIDMTMTVANLIAARIAQARLFQAEHDQRMLAEALSESAALMNRTLYYDEVLDRILDTMERVVPCDFANIMLIDAESTARVARGRTHNARDWHDLLINARLSVAATPTLRQMLETWRPLVIGDTANDPRWITFPGLEWERSYAGAPIRTKGQVVGFLQVTSETPHFYTEQHAARLQAFADQAATAIDNARLYDQAQHYADELEQRVAERTSELSEAYGRLKALDQVKDEFVSRVSHELRTPITNIKMYLGLLEKGKPEKRSEYMQTLNRETLRLHKMIEDLLDISHLDMGTTEFHFAATDVNQLVSNVITHYKANALERGLILNLELPPDIGLAYLDAALITQALNNVLTNALQYTPAGGSIECRTAQRRYADRNWLTISIKDSGPGLAPDELPHVGERFYRGRAARSYKVPGTGLGLALAKEIIDRHGGRLTVDSEPGQGADFALWLRPFENQ